MIKLWDIIHAHTSIAILNITSLHYSPPAFVTRPYAYTSSVNESSPNCAMYIRIERWD